MPASTAIWPWSTSPASTADASYDIVNAASITGTFDTVTGRTPAGFTQSVTYSPTDVTLDLEGGGPIIVTPTNDTIFTALSTAALLAAQQANGALLTHMGELHLGTGSPKVQTALAATTPTQVAFTGTADQLADLLPEIPQAVGQMGGWFKAIGSFASLDGSISTPGFDTQAGGFLAGFDKAFSANLTGGIAARLSPYQSERGRRGQRQPRYAAPRRLRHLHAGRFRHRCHGGLCL